MSGEEKKSSSSNTVGRKASSAAAAGVLEGMDPETGNFIRDSPLNRQKKSPPLTPVATHTLPSSGSASLKTDLERGLKEAHSAATLSVGEAGVLKKTVETLFKLPYSLHR
jgi:hypothetical protein